MSAEIKPADNFISLKEPDSAASEAYRILRTNISLRDFDTKMQVINIISPGAQESKSTTILNLAYTYSQLGKKVILIDLDLRLPSMHKKLGLKNEKGLVDVVSNHVQPKDAIIRYTSKMDVLLSGSKTPYASELIQSKAMSSLMDYLRGQYDLIFIDCPPINLVTDGIITSTFCDGTILCIASGRNDSKELIKTKDTLKQFNVNILGIVMTRMPVAKKYYNDYGYNYGYGYTKDKKSKKK